MDDGSTCRVCHHPLRQPAVDGVCADCLRTPHTDGVSATATTRAFDTPLPSDEALTRTAPPRVPPAPRPRVEVALTEYLRAKHYRDPAKVAAGGYGTVFAATDAVGRRVAVKVLHHYLATELILSRFETEAVALSELDHPGLVRFHHYEPDAEGPLLVTEFVPGGTLAQSVKDGGPLPPRPAAGLLAEVAAVVQYLHDRGVIHRDLKPSNILLTADGRPKVADFGLAKRLADAGKHHTRSANSVGGTPEYCAPEQFRPGAATDARSDVYALGATLYAVLTGHPPFTREPDDDHCQKLIRTIETTPPAPLPADVPADLAAVCRKCLEKHPDDRYQSAAELAAVLGRIAQGLPVQARPVTEWVGRQWRAVMRVPLGKKLTAAAVLLLATAGLAAAVFYRPVPPPPPPPEPDPNDVAAEHLGREQTIDLIDNGWPRFQKKVFGQERLEPVLTADKTRHVAGVSEAGHSLILLTRDPGADRYRLTVRLCQNETPVGPNKVDAQVGVVLDYQTRTVFADKVQHAFTLFGFKEFDPGGAGNRRAEFTEYTLLRQGLEGITRYQSGEVGVPLTPYKGPDRPVRTLDLDVTPSGVTASVDGGPGVTHGRAEIEGTRYSLDQDKLRPDLLKNNPGAVLKLAPRPWTPRNPIGVYALGSALTVHSFEIKPLQ